MNKILVTLITLVLLATLSGCLGTAPDLGIKNGGLTPCPKTPNCVNSQATDATHFIKPIHFNGTREQAHHRLLQILKSGKRTKILMVQKNYIRTEFRSALFGFVDDVEFYFPETEKGETIIHIRSASRVGYSDLGANRKRIEQIRNQLYL